MKFLQPKIFLYLLLPLAVLLSLNKHSKDKSNSYHGVIWADAAGYYVHLPIWFIYGNKGDQFPKQISENTGDGFYIDSTTNKIVTKYPCGTAILEAPFFLVSHFFAFEEDGFSKWYTTGLYFSGVFYCCLGLFFLSKFLKKHFSPTLSVGVPLLLFFSTNLYYYSIDAPAMSHVYSFFLFSLFIYCTQQLLSSEKFSYYFLFFATLVLAVLVRPTNAIIILFPLFYEHGIIVSKIKARAQSIWKILLAVSLASFFAIPQLIYWKNTFGSAMTYSYGNETFSNWKHPFLLETWFSPNNGLFLYAPILLLSMIGIGIMIKKKIRLGYFLLFLFLLMSYLFASWWNWWFGCSLGARSFVEFYVFLSIPLAVAIETAWKKNITKYITIFFVAGCIFMYFDIEYYYDGCFYGGTWDWARYLKLLAL